MGIFDRMGKVIQSNLNALLDKAEDDKKLILLNLDEMDEQIQGLGRRRSSRRWPPRSSWRRSCDELRADVERWDRRAELALKSEDEALAREALKQKKRTSAELATTDGARAEQAAAALKMKGDLERMR